MIKLFYKKLYCVTTITLFLYACGTSIITPPAQSAATTTAQPTNTPAPTPTEDLAAQKQKILDEIVQDDAEYNKLVEQEKLSGTFDTQHNSENGQDFIIFTSESAKKIQAAYQNLLNQTKILYDQYLALYKQDYSPTPFPIFNTKEQSLNFYYQALQEDQAWMDAQLKAENARKIFDPDRGVYVNYLNFEQAAWLGLKGETLDKLRMDAELPPDLQAKHKTIVEKLDGGSVVSNEIDGRPYYRNDLTLFQYKTQKNYYLLNADSAIIEITPVDQTGNTQLVIPSSQPAPNTPFTQSQLEQQARAFINLIAPGTNLDSLKPSVGGKIDDYFFKWEDQTKPPLDGGGFPFIQVAINTNSELLNYINTLPLAR